LGKTSKPVRILVLDRDLYESAEVQDLIAKGHPVSHKYDAVNPDDYDLILGRRAWYCDTKHLKYLEKIAIPAVRKRADYQKEKLKDAA
jgi:hypothetical protein